MNAYPLPAIPAQIQRICNTVAAHYGFTVDELIEQCRFTDQSYARRVTWFLLRTVAGIGWKRIAGLYQRDHSTVMKGTRTLAGEMEVNKDLRDTVEYLKTKIQEA